MVSKSNARCPLFLSPLAFSWSSTGFFGTDPDAFNTRPPGLAPVRPFAVLQRATREMVEGGTVSHAAGEVKCGGTPCGTSGLRALPGHDRPYVPTSGFSGEALTPLLCGPYGQSQSPNRPDLHGRPVKSHAGEPAVRNRKRRALPPAGRYSFRRVRTVLMRPYCIRRYGPRLSALRLAPIKGTTPSLTRLRNRFGLHVHSSRSPRSPGIEPRSSAPVISGNRIQESHACPGSNLLTPVRSAHA